MDSYFILWLREYTIKYRQWQVITAARRREAPQYLGVWPSDNSTQLAMFYARAKQTFLTPNANHELNLPSDILAPFHASNGSPHPDPAVFNHVAVEVQKMLNESLQRFVSAQFNNVGNRRVLCGIVAGIVCCLFGALFPLLYTIILGNSRWIRLTALPGLWLGITLLLTSLNGICLAVYVFGDLRQLRKFEMARPPISRPQPLYSSRRHPIVRSLTPPRQSVASIRSTSTLGSSCEIQISPAYYEMDPVEGPAISPISGVSSLEKHRSGFDDDCDESSGDEEYPPTALFIHPFIDPESSMDMSDNESTFPVPKEKPLPEELQRISEFDFDTLPAPARRASSPQPVIIVPDPPQVDNGNSPKAFIRRIQSKCNINRWMVVEEKSSSIRRQFKKVKSVPAFASPLTRVLSPVVARGQWEIVVRSMLIAVILSWSLLGTLLAVPVIASR